MNNSKEYILSAATWFEEQPTAHFTPKNITKGVVIGGHDHAQILHIANTLLKNKQHEQGKQTSGFLTSYNRFVGRSEGALIALEADQIKEEKDIKRLKKTMFLFSEDLY